MGFVCIIVFAYYSSHATCASSAWHIRYPPTKKTFDDGSLSRKGNSGFALQSYTRFHPFSSFVAEGRYYTCNVLSLVWRNIDGFKRSTEHRRPISMRALFFEGRTSVLLWNNSAGTPDSPAGVTDGRLTQFPWIYRLSFLLKFSEDSRMLLKLGCRKKAHQKILFFFFFLSLE